MRPLGTICLHYFCNLASRMFSFHLYADDTQLLIYQNVNIGLPLLLTIGLPLTVDENALYRRPDQHFTTSLLNNWNDVKGNFTSAPIWVVCSTFVVVEKKSIDEKA